MDTTRFPAQFTIAAPQLFDGTVMQGPALVTVSDGLIESVRSGDAAVRGAIPLPDVRRVSRIGLPAKFARLFLQRAITSDSI